MGFPVLRLPFVTFDNVYKFLDIPDIIVFSRCSRSMKAIVKSKEGPSKDYRHDVRISANETSVVLDLHQSRACKRLLSWFLFTNEKPAWDADKVIIDDGARIGGVELTMREEKDKWRSTVKEEDYEKKLLAIITLLKDLFDCTIEEISLDSDAGNSFRKLFMESDVLHKADQMDFYHDTCTPEEMTFMLDHFTAGCMNLRPDCGPGFSYSKPLKRYPRLELLNSRWMNLNQILKLAETALYLELKNADMITDKDLKELVKWWMESDIKFLEVVYIQRSNGNRDRAAIMEGIQSTPARKKDSNEISFCDSVSDECYDKGLDIRRKDGVQATVMVEDSWFALGVLFCRNKIEGATDN